MPFYLLAFGFANLLMFWWLAAAGLPIVIHLWNKRKYREVSWAAIEYLLAAVRKNSRRIQFEQWLLLAIRTLIVALVVLAMSEPFLESAGLSFSTGQRTHKLLVIDGSYSMAYKPTDKTRFERAKQLAAQIVEESPQGDGFTLVLLANPPAVIVGSPAMEPRDFLEEIDNLKLTHGGADLPATLSKVEEVLQAADSSGLTRREVYFLTDLGRNTWVPDLGGAGAETEFRERLTRLAESATMVVLDLGQNNTENVAVTSLRTSDTFTVVGREATLDAEVRNFGSLPKGHHLVEFFVDGHRLKEMYVDLGPGEQAPVSLNYRFETPGDHVVEARLGADLLDVDNHRWLTLPVKEHLRVLCVDGKPAGGGLGGATDYLALALDPDKGEADGRAVGQARGDFRKLAAGARPEPLRLRISVQRRAIHRQRGARARRLLAARRRPGLFPRRSGSAGALQSRIGGRAGSARAAGPTCRPGRRSPVSVRSARLSTSAGGRVQRPRSLRPADHAGLQILSPASRPQLESESRFGIRGRRPGHRRRADPSRPCDPGGHRGLAVVDRSGQTKSPWTTMPAWPSLCRWCRRCFRSP